MPPASSTTASIFLSGAGATTPPPLYRHNTDGALVRGVEMTVKITQQGGAETAEARGDTTGVRPADKALPPDSSGTPANTVTDLNCDCTCYTLHNSLTSRETLAFAAEEEYQQAQLSPRAQTQISSSLITEDLVARRTAYPPFGTPVLEAPPPSFYTTLTGLVHLSSPSENPSLMLDRGWRDNPDFNRSGIANKEHLLLMRAALADLTVREMAALYRPDIDVVVANNYRSQRGLAVEKLRHYPDIPQGEIDKILGRSYIYQMLPVLPSHDAIGQIPGIPDLTFSPWRQTKAVGYYQMHVGWLGPTSPGMTSPGDPQSKVEIRIHTKTSDSLVGGLTTAVIERSLLYHDRTVGTEILGVKPQRISAAEFGVGWREFAAPLFRDEPFLQSHWLWVDREFKHHLCRIETRMEAELDLLQEMRSLASGLGETRCSSQQILTAARRNVIANGTRNVDLPSEGESMRDIIRHSDYEVQSGTDWKATITRLIELARLRYERYQEVAKTTLPPIHFTLPIGLLPGNNELLSELGQEVVGTVEDLKDVPEPEILREAVAAILHRPRANPDPTDDQPS